MLVGKDKPFKMLGLLADINQMALSELTRSFLSVMPKYSADLLLPDQREVSSLPGDTILEAFIEN